MELATIDIPRDEARKRFLEYRRSVRDRHDAEEAQIMRGYRALANGHQVIDLVATVRRGGTVSVPERRWRNRDMDLPNLAVMRADAKWCSVRRDSDGRVVFYGGDNSWGPRGNESRYVLGLPARTLPEVGSDAACHYDARAMVPPVPPGLRPRHSLANYHILWEAEWEAVAPKDPALLKHIGGDLYVVLAVWDLTELERTVLGGRFG